MWIQTMMSLLSKPWFTILASILILIFLGVFFGPKIIMATGMWEYTLSRSLNDSLMNMAVRRNEVKSEIKEANYFKSKKINEYNEVKKQYDSLVEKINGLFDVIIEEIKSSNLQKSRIIESDLDKFYNESMNISSNIKKLGEFKKFDFVPTEKIMEFIEHADKHWNMIMAQKNKNREKTMRMIEKWKWSIWDKIQ